MKNGWKSCAGCEETCSRIWELLVAHLVMMDYSMTKESVWAFWRTFRAFAIREDDALVLEQLYENHMSACNKAKVTKAEFVAYMTREG